MTELNNVEIAEPRAESSTPALRFKITNLRTNAYPNPLTESDYFGFKVGDIIKERYSNVIYTITGMERRPMSEVRSIDLTNRHVRRSSGGQTIVGNKKFNELALEYKKNANFGEIALKLKVLFRGDKEAQRNLYHTKLEMDYADGYGVFEKVDFDRLINDEVSTKSYVNRKINSLNQDIINIDKKILMLTKFKRISLGLPAEESVPDVADVAEIAEEKEEVTTDNYGWVTPDDTTDDKIESDF